MKVNGIVQNGIIIIGISTVFSRVNNGSTPVEQDSVFANGYWCNTAGWNNNHAWNNGTNNN